MRTTVGAMLHQGHTTADKMDKAAEAFWWPGKYRELEKKSESCPSCRVAGKNLKPQKPSTEINPLELLTEPNQEIQMDIAGPFKSKHAGTSMF